MNPSVRFSKRFLKFTAVSLAMAMGYESAAIPLAQAAAITQQLPSTSSSFSKLAKPNVFPIPSSHTVAPFRVPASIGSTVEVYAPTKSGRLVYHLQDVHNHVPAQINLSEIVSLLEAYAEKQGKRLVVAVEGVTGKVNTDVIARLPNQKEKEDVASGLLRAGYFLGEEYAAVTHAPGRIEIIGIETPELYKKNLRARSLSTDARKIVLAAMKETRVQLEKLTPHNFSPMLVALEKKRIAVEEGTLPLGDYVSFLKNINSAVVARYPNLSRMAALSAEESGIDFEQVEKEGRSMVEELMVVKSDAEIDQMLSDAQALKEGRLSALSYYSILIGQAKNDYPMIRRYVAYLRSSEAIDTDALFDEVLKAESQIAKDLVRHPMALELYSHLRWVERQERFFGLNMIPQEWQDQKPETEAAIIARHNAIRAFVAEQVGDLGYRFTMPSLLPTEFSRAYAGARTFYTAASLRDITMANNFISVLNQRSADETIVAFVAGGFHTQGMLKILKHRGVAYEVIRPQLDTDVELSQDVKYPAKQVSFLRAEGGAGAVAGELSAGKTLDDAAKAAIEKPAGEIPPTGGAAMGLMPLLAFGFDLNIAGAIGAFLLTATVAIIYRKEIGAALGFSKAPVVAPQKAATLDGLSQDQQQLTKSNQLISDLYAKKEIDGQKLQNIRDYSAAMQLPVIFVEAPTDGPKARQSGGKLYLSINFISNKVDLGSSFPVNGDWNAAATPTEFAKLDLPITNDAYNKLQAWAADAQAAKEQDMTPSDLHNKQLAESYAKRLNEKLSDKEFLKLFASANPKLLSYNEADIAGTEAQLRKTIQSWFDTSLNDEASTEARAEAFNNLKVVIGFLSAVPKSMDSDQVKPAVLPNESDIFDRPDFKGQVGVDDVNTDGSPIGPWESYKAFPKDGRGEPLSKARVQAEAKKEIANVDAELYSGRFVHRVFVGGWARRLGLHGPAALVTPRQAVEQARKNGQPDAQLPEFPDVPVLSRFIIQILTTIHDIAEQNNWDVQQGLNNQKFVIPVNDETAELIINHIKSVDFYGLPRANFIFVSQGVARGLGFENGRFTAQDATNKGEKGPYGHGELEYKHNLPNEYFTIRGNNQRSYGRAPLHDYFGAQDAIYNHFQISLNDALSRSWVSGRERYALALASIGLGFAGTAEFRKYSVNGAKTKGGMTGLSEITDENLAAYFGKSSGMVTVEGSQVETPYGQNIKKKLQGYTSNASIVLMSAKAMAQAIKAESFPLPLALRNGNKIGNTKVDATTHPDTWSYWYFNLLNTFAWIPNAERRELKEPEHFPLFVEDVQKQDAQAESSEFYRRMAKHVQDQASSQYSVQAFSTSVPVIGSILLILIPVIGSAFGVQFLDPAANFAAIGFVLAGLVGLLVSIAVIEFEGRAPFELSGTSIEKVKTDSRYNQANVNRVIGFAKAAGFEKVLVDSNVTADADRASKTLTVSPFLLKYRFFQGLILPHEYVHNTLLQLPSSNKLFRFVNELIAYPLGLVLAVYFAVVGLPGTGTTDETGSFVNRTIDTAASNSGETVAGFQSELAAFFDKHKGEQVNRPVNVAVDVSGVAEEDLGNVSKAVPSLIATLHIGAAKFSETRRDATVAFFSSDEDGLGNVDAYQRTVQNIKGNVGADLPAGVLLGTSKKVSSNPQAVLADVNGINPINIQNGDTYLVTSDEFEDYLTQAAYSFLTSRYGKTFANDNVKELVRILKKFPGLQSGNLTGDILTQLMAAIMA